MAANETVFESDGKAVEVTLLATVKKFQVAYVDSWLGLTHASGDSGDIIALSADRREYQFEFPAALSANKGDTVKPQITRNSGTATVTTEFATIYISQ